jgi:hypothetical protein
MYVLVCWRNHHAIEADLGALFRYALVQAERLAAPVMAAYRAEREAKQARGRANGCLRRDILALLANGPRTCSEIVAQLAAHQPPAVRKALSRITARGEIVHVRPLYSLPQTQPAPAPRPVEEITVDRPAREREHKLVRRWNEMVDEDRQDRFFLKPLRYKPTSHIIDALVAQDIEEWYASQGLPVPEFDAEPVEAADVDNDLPF